MLIGPNSSLQIAKSRSLRTLDSGRARPGDRFTFSEELWAPISPKQIMDKVTAPIATRADDFTTQFDRNQGWTGADGTYSVPLPDGKTMWLFSDTFWGKVAADGSRAAGTQFINNSIAIQDSSGNIGFHHGGPKGKPKAIFTPPDGKGWFWLHDAVADSRGVTTILLGQFEKNDNGGALGFRNTGAWLANLELTDIGPTVSGYQKIPHFREGLFFGSSVMKADGFVYIYGAKETDNRKDSVLARVPEDKFADPESWDFFDGTGWNRNMEAAASVTKDVSMEYSVHKDKSGDYVMVTQGGGLSPDIQVRRADKPEGPWSEPTVVWTAPEQDTVDIAYNAKAHPELSDERGVLISYNVNSLSWERNLSNADIYRPRFIRVKGA